MVDRQEYFTADLNWVTDEHVESVNDSAVGGVLDWDDSVGSLFTKDLLKDRADTAYWFETVVRAKELCGGLVAIRMLRPQINDRFCMDSGLVAEAGYEME